jgi:hypothetical protein
MPDAEVLGDPNGFRLQNYATPLNELDELPMELTPLLSQHGERVQFLKDYD